MMKGSLLVISLGKRHNISYQAKLTRKEPFIISCVVALAHKMEGLCYGLNKRESLAVLALLSLKMR